MLNIDEIENNQIETSGHCFGCTAGQARPVVVHLAN